MITYSILEASRIFGIEKSRVRNWIVKGYIIPSWHKAMARGDKHLLTYDNLCYIYLFQQFRSKGLHRTAIAFIISEIEKTGLSKNLESGLRYVIWNTKNPKEGGIVTISLEIPTVITDTLMADDRRAAPRGSSLMLVIDLLEVKNEVDRKREKRGG